MPINPRASHGEKVREVLHSFHQKGTIGNIHPSSGKKASQIANAIAYRMEREKKPPQHGPGALASIKARK